MNRLTSILIAVLSITYAGAQNALQIPSTLSGKNINLNLQHGSVQFFAGQTTSTMGANGNILGPTLILEQGDFVNFSVKNQLADTTTLHWHGLHVSSEHDGGPHTIIPPGTTWSPKFTILDKAATYWYHPHLHHHTDEHVSKGIAGLIIVKDKEEASLALPRTYGSDDFPIVIQTKDFDANNQIMMHSNSDKILMVNATLDPYLDVPSQVVRFRVLNGSSQRAFNIGLNNNQAFYQIASDGGLLNAPVQLTRLLLAPGERAELLIDFTGMNAQTTFLKSFASELQNGIYGATNPGMGAGLTLNGYKPNTLNGSDFNIIKFVIGAKTANPVTTIPSKLVTVTPILASTSNIIRQLTFTPAAMGPTQLNGNFLINNAPYDMMVVNYTIPFNNTEIWELTNQSGIAHPFHIHDVQFYILTRGGIAPPANEQGRKDVVLVKPQETVRFIAKFENFSNEEVPYMFHCHLLTHEDGGMMGQFVVSKPLISVQEQDLDKLIKVFPNPSQGELNIEVQQNLDIESIVVYDYLGRTIRHTLKKSNNTLKLNDLSSGIYHLVITTTDYKSAIKKVLVH